MGNTAKIFLQIGIRYSRIARKYRGTAIWGMVFGLLLYSLMMTQQLTNPFDGMWQQNYYISGSMELSSGRWLLLYVDRLAMGLHADPMTSMVSLLLYVGGFLLVLDLFEIESKLWAGLGLAVFLSSTLVSCTLSYRYTSVGYALAFILATLSAHLLFRSRRSCLATGLSGVLLGLVMACYQAYLAVFCTVSAFYGIFLCWKASAGEAAEKKEPCGGPSPLLLLRFSVALCIGAAFYVLSLAVFLRIFRTELSHYNGIGDTSFGGLFLGMPRNIVRTFQYFMAYFFQNKLKINRLQFFGVFYLLMGLLLGIVILVAIRAWKRRGLRGLSVGLLAMVLPITCNAYMLVAGNKLELQMTAGLAMFPPLVMLLASLCFRGRSCLHAASMLLCAMLIFGNSMQTLSDQEAMYEGQNACDTMMMQVISDLDREGVLSQEYRYFFVGVPAESPWFHVSDAYHRANAYGQMGRFWVSGHCCAFSYSGLIERRLGFALPIAYDSYEDIAERLELSAMPMFPDKGYFTLLDERTVVVKICEYAPYSGDSKYVIDRSERTGDGSAAR